MITGVIFDLDGTLVDSNAYWDRAPDVYLREMGKNPPPGIGQRIFTMTVPEAAAYLQREFGLNRTADEIVQGINSAMKQFYLHDIPLKDGAEAAVRRLAGMGIPMAVASVTDRDLVAAVLGRFGLTEFIRCIVTIGDVGVGKQAPDIYLLAAEKIGSRPENTLVFEDALHALQTAGKAGFRTVGIYDDASAGRQEEIRRASGCYIRSFREMDRIPEIGTHS